MSNMPKGLPFFIIVWIIGIILGSTYDGNNTSATWAGTGSGSYSENPQTTMNNLMDASQATQKLPLIGALSFVVPAANFFMSLFKIVTWQFSFLSPYPFIALLFFGFGVMGLASLILLIFNLVRGNIAWG
jgi:hypothetical protein